MADTDDDTDIDPGGDQSDYQDQLELAQFRQTSPGVYSPAPALPAQPQQALTPPRYQRPPEFNPSRAAPSGEAFSFPPPPKEEQPSNTTFGGDLVRYGLNDLRGWGQDLLGVGRALNDQFVDSPGARDAVKGWQKTLSDDIQATTSNMSPTRQSAARANFLRTFNIGPATDEQGNAIPSPFENGVGGFADYAAQRLASFAAPIVALSMLPEEGIVAAATGALAFGLQTAGQVYTTIADKVDQTPDAQYRKQSEAYDTMRANGLTEDQAKLKALNSSWVSILGAFGAGAAGGAGFGRIFNRGVAEAGTGALATRAIGAAEAGATMGVQAGGAEAATQTGQIGAGVQKDFDYEALAREAAAGTLTGAVVGGVFAGRRSPEKVPEPPPSKDVDPAVGAAMLQIEGPKEPLLLTHDTADQQALPSPTDTSINVPAGPGQITTPPPPTGPVSFGDVNTAPVTRGPEPPPPPPPGAAAPPPPEPPLPPPAPPAAPIGAPPATQAAIDVSRGPAPIPTVEPTARPSEGMSRQQLSDALTGQVDPKALKSMSAKDMAARYDKLAPGAEPTTVVKASEGPPTSEPAAPLAEGAAAPPPSPSGVGSLPVAAELGAKSSGELTAKSPAGVRPKGGTASGLDERPAQVTTPPKTAAAAERRAQEALVSTTWGSTSHQELGEALKTRGVDAAAVDAMSRSQRILRLNGMEARAGPAATPPQAVVEVADEVAEAREAALEKVANARRALQVPRGTPVEKLTNQAWAEIQSLISHSSGSPKDLATLVSRFVQPRDNDAPGVLLARRGVGDRVYQEFTGKKLVLTRVAAAAREETTPEVEQVRREEQARGGAEARSPEAIEEKATGGGEGESAGQTMGLEVVHKNVSRATDRARTARDLIDKVLDPSDPMTVEEADRQYGKPVPGAGRPRREGLETFANAIDKEIKRVETPGAEQKLRDQLRTNELDTNKDDDAREAQSRFLERKLEDYNPERIAQLKAERAKLVDPVGHVADLQRLRDEIDARTAALKGEPKLLRHAPGELFIPGINPRSSRMVRIARDPRMSVNLVRAKQASSEYGAPFTARDAMRTVMQDPLVGAEQPGLKVVATRLFKLVHDIPVYTPQEAYDRGHIGSRMLEEYRDNPQTYGHYDPTPGNQHIVLNIGAEHQHGSHAETAVHEVMHAVYSHHIDNLMRYDPGHRDLQALHAIREELNYHLREAELSGQIERGSPEHDSLLYALSNPQELHTMLMTNPAVQAFASSVRATDLFAQDMKQLGFAPRQGRSVWSHFVDVVRKALGFDPPKSASEYTLFDHLARPITDIAEHAAKYHEKLMPKDPVLRAQAEPLYHAASSALYGRARDALSNIDVRGLGDKARRVVLQGATSDGIVARYARLLPGLERWRAAYEGITRSGKQFADAYADKVKDLTARYNKLDDPKALGQLMTDATLAKAHLGPGATNAHLTTDAEKAALGALQARYARLPAPAKALYNEFKDTYAAWYKQKRTAELGALVRGFMPDVTDAQHEALTRVLSRKSSLDNFLKETAKEDATTSDVAKAFSDQWKENRKLARGIAQVHNQGFVQGDYFPLRRFGNYVVRYGDKSTPGDYGVEMFESRRKAELRRAELAAAGMEPFQVSDKREGDLRDIVPNSPMVDELTASLARRGYPEGEVKEIRDQLNSILLQQATHSAASRAAQGMRRRGVLGASADQAHILSSEFINNQIGIGHLEHGLERAKAISHMRAVELPALESQNYKGHAGDAITAASVLREIEQRSVRIDPDSVLQSIGANVNNFSFAQSLMSPSHMLTASMEAHTNGMALLGARHGLFKAGAALTRALAQASPMLKTGAGRTLQAVKGELKAADWNMPEMLKQRMIAKGSNKAGMAQLFKSLEDANLIDHTMLKDIQQQANPSSRAGGAVYNVWSRFRDFSAASAHSVDVMNKVAIAKAAFDLEYAKTKDINASVEYATKIARTAMPNYNIGNKARIATSHGTLGAFGSPLFQFKNYGLHMYTTLANLAQESMHGENKWEARKAFALMLATHAAMAGVLGLPIADALRYIGGAYDLITGAAKPHNYENDLRQGIASVFGPTLGDVISGGLPHAAGFDVQHRVGLSNLLEIPEMASFDSAGAKDVLFGLMLGASGENLSNAMGGVDKVLQGDILGGVQAMVPRPFRDVMKASNLAEKGVVTQRGRTILPPEKISPWDVALQATGFQPSRVTEARAGSAAVQQAHDEAQAEHMRLTQRWLAADPAERQNVWQEIAIYNQNSNNLGFRITRDQLLRDQREQQKRSRVPGAFGLRLPSKGAQQLIGAGSFANVQ